MKTLVFAAVAGLSLLATATARGQEDVAAGAPLVAMIDESAHTAAGRARGAEGAGSRASTERAEGAGSPASTERAGAPAPAPTAEPAPTVTPAPAPAPTPGTPRVPSRLRSGIDVRSIAVTGGGVAPSVIDSVVRSRLRSLAQCHERALSERPTVRGRVTIRLTFAADGSVSGATVRSTLRDPAFDQCAREAAQHWAVPMPIGRTARVVATLDLSPRLRW